MTDDHRHESDEHSELDEMELRVRALQSVLAQKGYIDPAALDVLIDTYQTKIGPRTKGEISRPDPPSRCAAARQVASPCAQRGRGCWQTGLGNAANRADRGYHWPGREHRAGILTDRTSRSVRHGKRGFGG
jgi:hypothetical protein